MVYINTTGKHNEVWLDKPYATITVECPDCPSTEDAYNSGWTDGSEDGYHKGYQSGFTDGLNACSGGSCEGIWEEGYDSGVTDAWQPAYDSGYTDGLNACSGGSCEGIWEDGYLSGVTDQKNKLTSTAITQNGTYTRADGWSSVTINVSGYSQADLDAAFASGYTAGLRDCSGYTPATSITLNVDSAITGTGQASVTVNPSDAGTDITYTSSDPSVATIDENGTITVLQDGTVTFCAIDQITELQDCKTVSVSLPIPANTSILDFIYETSAANQTIRLFTGTAPDSPYFYAFYSAITRMDIDGVPVEKSENNIYKTYPRSGDWYFYTFPTAGRHNVKYYVQTNFHPSGLIFPGLALNNLIFSQSDGYDGSHPEYPDAMPPCPLVEAHVGEGYVELGQGVFQSNTTLTAVTLSETLVTLGTYAFEESGIISIVIPDACTSLYGSTSQPSFFNGEVFVKAPNLSSVTIGSGITSIPSNTFYGCSALTTVVMRNPVPPTVIRTETYVVPGTRLEYVELFETCPLEHIYVPAEAVEDYKTATFWSDHASIISAIQ